MKCALRVRPRAIASAAAVAAVFVIAGGPGATVSVAAELIGSADVTDDSLRGVDVKDRSLRSPDFHDGSVRSGAVRDGSLRAEDFADGVLGSTGAPAPMYKFTHSYASEPTGDMRATLQQSFAGPATFHAVDFDVTGDFSDCTYGWVAAGIQTDGDLGDVRLMNAQIDDGVLRVFMRNVEDVRVKSGDTAQVVLSGACRTGEDSSLQVPSFDVTGYFTVESYDTSTAQAIQ